MRVTATESYADRMEALARIETPSNTDFGPVLFQDVLDRFVQPDVAARHIAGELPTDTAIHRFQVLLHPEGEPDVRLNEQVGGMVKAVATRTIEAGEEVTTDDFSGVSSYEPMPEDVGVPHITAFAHRGGWSVAFDFTYRHPRSIDYLAGGHDFADTAREALAAGRVGAALDNAFSAVELFAKAELLSCRPTINEVISSRTHGSVATPYALWARLGNTDRRYVQLLYRLQELRGASRYLDKGLALKDGEPATLFDLLADMEAHVRRVAHGEDTDDEPQGFTVIARRDVRAGQLVTQDDFTLRPPKSP